MAEEYVEKIKSLSFYPLKRAGLFETLKKKTHSSKDDEELIKLFIPEFSEYLDEDGNNIPMIAIQHGRIKLAIELITMDIFNVNHQNNSNKTIFYYAFKLKNVDFCIQLITLYGYDKFDVFDDKSIVELCMEFDEYLPLLPYLVKNKYKKTVADKLLIYEDSFFDEDTFKDQGEGAYGKVVRAKGKDGKLYALKTSVYENDSYMPSDFFKEMMVSRIINKKFPKTIGEIYGFYPKTKSLVMEYLPFTLENILHVHRDIDIEYKIEIIKELFRSIIESVRNINSCGFCHFDLKPGNIMIDENGHIRIIDLGLSGFIGLEPIKLKEFFQSWEVKGPDDPSEIIKYYLNGEEIFIKEKEESYNVNYSTDLYAIASMMLGMIYGSDEPHQMLYTKNQTYIYRKTSKLFVHLEIMPDKLREDIEKFSPHLFDFFIRSFSTNSNLRMTSFEALDHPLFDGQPNRNPQYSISEIRIEKTYESFISPEEQLMLMNGTMKCFENFKDVYSNVIISKGKHFLDFGLNVDDAVDLILNNDSLDSLLNYCIYERIVESEDIFADFDHISVCINECLSNKNNDDVLDMKTVKTIMENDIIFIPFKSIIISYITTLRINGIPPNKIATLLKNIISSLISKLLNNIDEVNISKLFDEELKTVLKMKKRGKK